MSTSTMLKPNLSDSDLQKLGNWVRDARDGKPVSPLWISGEYGTGKSCLAYALAKMIDADKPAFYLASFMLDSHFLEVKPDSSFSCVVFDSVQGKRQTRKMQELAEKSDLKTPLVFLSTDDLPVVFEQRFVSVYLDKTDNHDAPETTIQRYIRALS